MAIVSSPLANRMKATNANDIAQAFSGACDGVGFVFT
jgi:hypothetical protein